MKLKDFFQMYTQAVSSFLSGAFCLRSINRGFFLTPSGRTKLSHQDEQNLKVVEQDFLKGSFDFEGYKYRLMLAATVELSFLPIIRLDWLQDIWGTIVGQQESEVRRDIEEGEETAYNGFMDLPVPILNLNRWNSFCAASSCSQRRKCLFLLSGDTLGILNTRFLFPNTKISSAVSSTDPSREKLVDDLITLTYNPGTRMWPSDYAPTPASPREPQVTALMLEYLALKHASQSPVNLIDVATALVENKGIFSGQDLIDGIEKGLWESIRILRTPISGSKFEYDHSISPTFEIGNALIHSIPRLQSIRGKILRLLKEIVQLGLKVAANKSFLTRCYGRDYYLKMSPLSDVKGAVQLADFLLNSLSVEELVRARNLRAQVRPRLIDLVQWVMSAQRDGFWPILSEGNYQRAKELSTVYNEDFLVFQNQSLFNLSLINTFESLRVLARIISFLASRYCAICKFAIQNLNANFCPNCGNPLQ